MEAVIGHKTAKDYYNDTYQYSHSATVLQVLEADDQHTVITDRTIFHPQGGGQPSDKGTIVSEDGATKFEVKLLKHKDDAILHIGSFAGDTRFAEGEAVKMEIDGEFRSVHAKIHSAGHLLDMAMTRAGRKDLKPGKGYHFVEGPYVEYVGVVEEKEREPLIADLNKYCAEIIAEAKEKSTEVFRKVCDYGEAGEHLAAIGGVPDYIPEGQELRVLKLTPDDLGCPCGGTHVHSVVEIGSVEVTRMKKKKKNTQVSYKVVAA